MEAIRRGKVKIKKDYRTEDIYKFYCSQSKNPVSYKKFFSFLFDKNGSKEGGLIKELTNEMIYNAYILRLPWGGDFGVFKYKPKTKFKDNGDLDFYSSGLTPNWAETKKLWKEDSEAYKNRTIIYHTNKHTRGYKYDFFWNKKNMALIKNKTYYKINTVRKLDRELAKVLQTPDSKVDFFDKTYL